MRVGKGQRNLFGGLVAAWYRRPLAVMLTLLILGAIPEFRMLSLIPQAWAQFNCVIGQNRIMQNCAVPASFETEGVASFLEGHELPPTDAPLLYQYGRKELRGEVRAFLYAKLAAIIRKQASLRTPDEQATYNWIQNIVWEHQKEQYSAAMVDRDFWKTNPCNWRIDADIAEQTNLQYNPSQWCSNGNNLAGYFTIAPTVPTKAYFLTRALKYSYATKIGSTAGGPVAYARLLDDESGAIGYAALTGVGVIGGIVAGLVPAMIFVTAQQGTVALSNGFGLLNAAGRLVFAGANATGPVGIIVTAVLTGAIATFQVYEQQKTLKELETITSDYNWILNNKPNLEEYVTNPVGAFKVRVSFTENAIPDFPSTEAPPGRKPNDRNFVITPVGGTGTVSPTFTHLDWRDTKWTVQPHGGWLSAQGVKKDNTTDANFGVSIEYKDWNGVLHKASRIGLHFQVTKLVPGPNDTLMCKPDSTGVTPGDVSRCVNYITTGLKLLDANGARVTVRLTNFPIFTSPEEFPVDLTNPSLVRITASGDPLPVITATSALPNGFTLDSSTPGVAVLTVTGVPAATYNLTFQANNGTTPATQSVAVLANIPVAIQGTDNFSVYGGQPYSIRFAVTGSPAPALTCTGNTYFQSTGAVFTDNHDGTGTLSGTMGKVSRDAANNPVSPVPVQCTLTATNGLTTDSKAISVFGKIAPEATITTPTAVTWVDNETNELVVKAQVAAGEIGVPNISFSFPCPSGTANSQPAWLTLKDNGKGTAVLTGRPPFGTTSVPLLLYVSTAEAPRCYSGIRIGPNGLENIPIPANINISVLHVPELPSPSYYAIQAGVPVNVSAPGTPAGGDGSVSGDQPPGITFTGTAFSGWNVTGTAAIGSGGEYNLLYTAISPSASTSEIFSLYVLEAPKIVSRNTVTFQAGLANGYFLETTGFPKATVPGRYAPMRVQVQGTLPAGVTFTDLNTLGNPTGTGILSGTPPAGLHGTYPLTVTASNGIGTDAVQMFTLRVTVPGDANDDGVVNCADVDILAAAFGSFRGDRRFDDRADLNLDGAVNFQDLDIVQRNLPATVRCAFSMPFQAFISSLSITNKGKSFDLTSNFTLNPLNNGMDPAAEPMSLKVAGYSVTIPKGSFKQLQNGAMKGGWTYNLSMGSMSVTAQMTLVSGTTYQLKMSAAGVNLGTVTNPVPVALSIGDDVGQMGVNASIK